MIQRLSPVAPCAAGRHGLPGSFRRRCRAVADKRCWARFRADAGAHERSGGGSPFSRGRRPRLRRRQRKRSFRCPPLSWLPPTRKFGWPSPARWLSIRSSNAVAFIEDTLRSGTNEEARMAIFESLGARQSSRWAHRVDAGSDGGSGEGCRREVQDGPGVDRAGQE